MESKTEKPKQSGDEPTVDYFSSKPAPGDEDPNSSVYKRLANKILPSPLYPSTNGTAVPDADHDDDEEDVARLPNDGRLLNSATAPKDLTSDTDEDDINVANILGLMKPQRNILNFIAPSQIYSDIYNFMARSRSDSSTSEGSKAKPPKTPSSGYGVASDSSDDEDDNHDEESSAEVRHDESDVTDTDEFEDANDDLSDSRSDARSDATTMKLSNSTDSETFTNNSLFDFMEKPYDQTKLTNFQKSMKKNFKLSQHNSVITRYTDNGGDLSVKMKLSIADRLQKVFNLADDDYFYSNFDAWLVRDVFLQGHIYLTRDCLLFFAFLPEKFSNYSGTTDNEYKKFDDSNEIIQSGGLTMKTKKYGEILGSVLTNRFWAILRSETLSVYTSPNDMYFPTLVVDLKRCTKVEILEKYQPKTEHAVHTKTSTTDDGVLSPRETLSRRGSNDNVLNDEEELNRMLALEAEENKDYNNTGVWFKISTNKRSYKFQADNMFSAREWVNNIKKLLFQLHNANPQNEVLIKVPFNKMNNFVRRNLFTGVNEHDEESFDETLPSAFALNYSTGTTHIASQANRMQLKFYEQGKPSVSINDTEDLHFAFFNKSDEFFKLFAKILTENLSQFKKNDISNSERLMSMMRRHSRDEQAGINEPMSTLSPYNNSSQIIDQLISFNKEPFGFTIGVEKFANPSDAGNRLKKLSRSISSKVFLGNRAKRSFDSNPSSSNVSITLPSSPTDSAIVSPVDLSGRSSESGSPQNLHLPRQLSLTGLKNLNMSFDTTKRSLEHATDRYEDSNLQDQTNGARELANPTPVKPLLPAPLNLSDPSEYSSQSTKKSTLKNIGKGIKAISNVTTAWNSQPSHYVQYEPEDPYYILDEVTRDIADRHYRTHFSLSSSNSLSASYYCHVQRTLPVYGKLYVGNEFLCFRSLLPGVSTKMIIPLTDVETCYKEKGTKITYSGLVVVLKGFEEIFIEFSSQKARDDCLQMNLEALHIIHGSETWEPMSYEWGKNFDPELRRKRLDAASELTSLAPSEETLKLATLRIESARVKLFEDRFTAAAGLQVPIVLEDSPFTKTEIRPNTSYHFVLLTIGSRGDVQPYIALGKGLIAEGHKVTIATHSEFKDWIVSHNLAFREIAGDPTELMSLMVTHGSMSVAFIKEASVKFKGWITELLYTSWTACQDADILIESPSAMAGVHIAEALGIPYLRAFTMPWTRTRAYSHAFISPDQKKGGSYNYLTHLMFETVFWKGISSQVNKWRVETLNIPKTNLFKLQQYKIPFMYNVSQAVLSPAVDFPDWVKVTGYWFLDEGSSTGYKPPEELVKFMEKARDDLKKIVYIGFGSIVVNDAKSLTQAVIDAVLSADVRCILNKGWSDRNSHESEKKVPEIELPPEIYNSGSIPHDWLFPRIDAAVHHGGSGTTGATLRSGLPTVIKPFFGDQFFYSIRIEEIGAGVALRKLNAKSLSKALKQVTTDLKMIERASKISVQIKNEHGVLSAIETIYSQLEYARSLIINKQLASEQSSSHLQSRTGTSTLNTPQNEEIDDDSSIEIEYSSDPYGYV